MKMGKSLSYAWQSVKNFPHYVYEELGYVPLIWMGILVVGNLPTFIEWREIQYEKTLERRSEFEDVYIDAMVRYGNLNNDGDENSYERAAFARKLFDPDKFVYNCNALVPSPVKKGHCRPDYEGLTGIVNGFVAQEKKKELSN